MARSKKSTNGRTPTWAQVLLRTGFRTLEPVAPGVAVRWAVRIWCTPPRPRRRRSSAPELAPGARFAVPVPGLPHPVAAEAWGGSGPVTYLLHGWGGWRGQLTALVAPLLAAGYRVVALDTPSHGDSGPGQFGPRRTTLIEMSRALAAVVAVTGPAEAIIAHSGGAAATTLAVRDGLRAGRLVYLAPMANPLAYLEPFAAAIGLPRRSVPRVAERLARLVDLPVGEFDLPRWVAGAGATAPDRLPPLLVIHDRADREVRYSDGQAMARAWPGARLHTTDGLGHRRRLLTNPGVVAEAVAFAAAGRTTGDRITPAAAGNTGRN